MNVIEYFLVVSIVVSLFRYSVFRRSVFALTKNGLSQRSRRTQSFLDHFDDLHRKAIPHFTLICMVQLYHFANNKQTLFCFIWQISTLCRGFTKQHKGSHPLTHPCGAYASAFGRDNPRSCLPKWIVPSSLFFRRDGVSHGSVMFFCILLVFTAFWSYCIAINLILGPIILNSSGVLMHCSEVRLS